MKKDKKDSLQDKQDREVKVCDIHVGAGGLRLPTVDVERGGVSVLLSATIANSVPIADGVHTDDRRPDLRAHVMILFELMPYKPRYIPFPCT